MSKPDRAYLSKRAQREAIDEIERTAPSQAIAVLRWIDRVERPPTARPNYRQRREQERRTRKQGHPGRTTSQERRRQWHDKPDAREYGTREINRLVRKYREKMTPEDGDVGPLLAAIAEFVVLGSPMCREIPYLLDDFDLGPEHAYPLQHWLTARFGDVIREPDIEGYLRWRAESLASYAAG